MQADQFDIRIYLSDNNNFHEPTIQPLHAFWNDIRHIRGTLVFLKSLISENNSEHKEYWQKEFNGLKQKLKELHESFLKAYKQSLCILKEFELNKYDRMYLEIMFLRSEWN